MTSKAPVKLTGKKIESPLAKYNNVGQLTCIVCNVIVKSEMVWTAHINGKQHRDKIEELKQPKKVQDNKFVKPQAVPAIKRKGELDGSSTSASPSKKGIPEDFFDRKPIPIIGKPVLKPIKSILKNAPKLPAQPPPISDGPEPDIAMETDNRVPSPVPKATSSELPEGFFDDPKLDAKV